MLEAEEGDVPAGITAGSASTEQRRTAGNECSTDRGTQKGDQRERTGTIRKKADPPKTPGAAGDHRETPQQDRADVAGETANVRER